MVCPITWGDHKKTILSVSMSVWLHVDGWPRGAFPACYPANCSFPGNKGIQQKLAKCHHTSFNNSLVAAAAWVVMMLMLLSTVMLHLCSIGQRWRYARPDVPCRLIAMCMLHHALWYATERSACRDRWTFNRSTGLLSGFLPILGIRENRFPALRNS